MKKEKELMLPKLSDVEDTIDNLSYNISDICIDYFNKGIEQGRAERGKEILDNIDNELRALYFLLPKGHDTRIQAQINILEKIKQQILKEKTK